MNFQRFLAATAVMVLLSGAAYAEDESAKAKDVKRPSMMERLDKDGDGGITIEESRQAASTRFDAMDTDKNGILSKEEAEKHQAAMQEKMKEKMAERAAAAEKEGRDAKGGKRKQRQDWMMKQFEAMDADGDGQVTKDQYVAKSDDKHKEMDADTDGKVTQAEIDANRTAKREKMRDKLKEKMQERKELRSKDGETSVVEPD